MSENPLPPALMIFADTFTAISKRLTDEELGQTMRAAYRYFESGEETTELSPMVGFAFDLLKAGIDKGKHGYGNQLDRSKYATYCKKCKREDIPPKSFDEWLLDKGEGDVEPNMNNYLKNGSSSDAGAALEFKRLTGL